jgi:hypothetical protein
MATTAVAIDPRVSAADVVVDEQTPEPGAVVVDGRPTAVVARDGSGRVVGEWRTAAGGSAPVEWTCRYHPIIPMGGPTFEFMVDYDALPVLDDGEPYALVCRDASGMSVYEEFIIWGVGDPLGLAAAEARAADLALAELDLPEPDVAAAPPLDADQLVGLDTWLWARSWTSMIAAAELGGVSATVNATPVRVSWSFGDGSNVVCEGPGLPWPPVAAPESTGQLCTYTPTHSSYSAPGGRMAWSATVTWDVRWSASTGAGGTLGALTTSTGGLLRVVEAQAVIEY